MHGTPAETRTLISDSTAALLAWAGRAMAPGGEAASELAAQLAASSEGGKAFRGRLILATFDACGGSDREAAAGAAGALELFQTAALLHDDVLDDSDTRRGRPAAHRAFEARHREAGWPGDPAAYGRAGAILAGDVALVAALRGATLAARRAGDVVGDLFDEMAALVTAGQHLDMRVAAAPWADLASLEHDITAVMRAKTASYTAEFPLALGAATAGAPAATIEALRAAGLPLGYAFQLRDDVLGLTGSPEVTGKPVGDDLREGKRTLLVWHVLAHGSLTERDAVLGVLGEQDASHDDLETAIAAVVSSGAIAAAEERIARHASEAREALVAALDDPEPVLALVDAAVHRSA
ncbi:polyprenyl synthetase family protein [Demequina mangrovi]|uniref:Geranylgeranyl diphosphate synthase, type I n=1 Tax=Demequina mangrovi TaxID=1043493 RepID=A0A1H6UAY8_9MICO|nr:polyprenyl synthetase family protein [Demequina mangrovi]SEI89519.1 geranylgeranyl diphosphate synthase, type I [Demequina mangrovi]